VRKIYHPFLVISSLCLIIFVSVFLTQNVEAENPIYHNSENHFSFKIPDGWMKTPQKFVDDFNKRLEKQPPTAFKNITILQLKKSTYWFDYPHFRVGINKKKTCKEEIKKLIASKKLKEAMDQVASEIERTSPLTSNMEIDKPIYDDKRNLILMKRSSHIAETGKVKSLMAIFLGNEVSISLDFYSLEDDYRKYMLDFSEVINSFKFDPGYEYK